MPTPTGSGMGCPGLPAAAPTPCALTSGFSRKASSPFSHLGSLRIKIRSPRQGSTMSPLLRDKKPCPGTAISEPPGVHPPTTAPPVLYSNTVCPTSCPQAPHLVSLPSTRVLFLLNPWGPPEPTGLPQGRMRGLSSGNSKDGGRSGPTQAALRGHLPVHIAASPSLRGTGVGSRVGCPSGCLWLTISGLDSGNGSRGRGRGNPLHTGRLG